jgi:hypothetical protein
MRGPNMGKQLLAIGFGLAGIAALVAIALIERGASNWVALLPVAAALPILHLMVRQLEGK